MVGEAGSRHLRLYPVEAVDPMENRCHATNRRGNQCAKPAIQGGTVCRMHGGAAPQVQRKAAERLAEARDDALSLLLRQIRSGEIEPRVVLDAVVKLTEVTETIEGRVAKRVGVEHTDREQVAERVGKLLQLVPHERTG